MAETDSGDSVVEAGEVGEGDSPHADLPPSGEQETSVNTEIEELKPQLEEARAAFEAVKQAAIREFSANQIPAENPVRQGPGVDGMSLLEKIAYGLKRD